MEFNLPCHLEYQSNRIKFAVFESTRLAEFPFHDQRILNQANRSFELAFENLNENEIKTPAFIFHSAFVGSTFLARLFGELKSVTSIREPQILMDLANIFRMNKTMNAEHQSLWTTHAISSFYYNNPIEQLLVKPTNASNSLIPLLGKVFPDAPALCLYNNLKEFLISILKKGEGGRSYIRKLYNLLTLDHIQGLTTDFRKVNEITDLQLACIVWKAQVEQLMASKKAFSSMVFLNVNDFFNYKEKFIPLIGTYLLGDSVSAEVKNLLSHSMLNRHAKENSRLFNTKLKRIEDQSILDKYRFELDEIWGWQKQYLTIPNIENDECFK